MPLSDDALLSPSDLIRQVTEEAARSAMACPCGWLAPQNFKGTATIRAHGPGTATFSPIKLTYQFLCPVCGNNFTGTCAIAEVERL